MIAGALALTGCVQVGVRVPPSNSAPPTEAAVSGGQTPGDPAAGTDAPAVSLSPAGLPSSAPPPGAGFIAYIQADDVWVVTPDGSVSQQVTRDGASGAYRDPTVAPDGTLFVLRNEDALYHLDTTGRVLAGPVPLGVLENGGEGLSIAPDGGHLAFVTTGWGTEVDPRFGTPTGTFIYGGTDVVTPDGSSVPGAAMGSLLYPSWSSASSLVLTDGVILYADTVGSQPVEWLYVSDGCVIPSDCPAGQEPQANFTRPVVNRAGTVLAYEYQPYFGTAGRRMATLEAPALGGVTVRCLIEGQQNHSDPGSFSTDGTLFAFDDTMFDPESLEARQGEGIWVMLVDLNAPDCGASSARLVAPGGNQPDFAP